MKKRIVTGIEQLAKAGLSLKAKGVKIPYWKRLLVDAAMLPLDALAASGAIKSSGGSLSDIIRPRTFSAKLMYRKLFGRRRRHIIWADKLAVREYVKNVIGPQYLVELLWCGSDLSAVNAPDLPNHFMIKANHASGTNFFVENKSELDWEKARAMTQEWLAYDHSVGNGEWQYRWIEPKLLIEKILEGPGNSPPLDFKFFCFHGKVQFVQIDFDRFTNHTRTLYDREFRPLPFELLYGRNSSFFTKPACFEEMVELAERLADDEPFVRVDLYEVKGKPVFGELTLHPGSGGEPFRPHEWDYKYGSLL